MDCVAVQTAVCRTVSCRLTRLRRRADLPQLVECILPSFLPSNAFFILLVTFETMLSIFFCSFVLIADTQHFTC